MRKAFHIIIATAAITFAACGGKRGEAPNMAQTPPDSAFLDDEMVYGLACSGCTDSVAYLLPRDCGDPVKYDILAASRRHKVFGRLNTGDEIAIVVNAEDSAVADMVINIEQLKGTWCFTLMPKLRGADKMPPRMLEKIMSEMDDSTREALFVPQEFGFTLSSNFHASPVGKVFLPSAKEESPVVYEESERRYQSWHLLNGKLVLSRREAQVQTQAAPDTTRSDGPKPQGRTPKQPQLVNDTAEILFMTPDTLALRFAYGVQGYYKKKANQD